MKAKKPWILEFRYRAWLKGRGWMVWSRYKTKSARDEAFKTISNGGGILCNIAYVRIPPSEEVSLDTIRGEG